MVMMSVRVIIVGVMFRAGVYDYRRIGMVMVMVPMVIAAVPAPPLVVVVMAPPVFVARKAGDLQIHDRGRVDRRRERLAGGLTGA